MPADREFSPAAQDDIADGHDWYEGQRAGLGGQFLDAIERCVSAVCGSPTRRPVWQGRIRRARLQGFPHYVYYEYDPVADRVSVATVFHPSRDPADLLRRLGLP